MQIILNYIRKTGQIGDEEVRLSIKKTRAYTLVKKMIGIGLLVSKGLGKEKI